MKILSNSKIIKDLILKNDPDEQFTILQNSHEQIEFAWQQKSNCNSINGERIKNIVLCGMGGSAISGDIISNLFRNEMNQPFIINRNYSLPHFVNENTLLIISSYSGNTEETISALREGLEKKCQICILTTGGKIEEVANKNNLPIIKLLNSFQPRFALWVNLFSIIKLFQELHLINNWNNNTKRIIELIKFKSIGFSKEQNIALEYAEKMVGYVPIIYSVENITSSIALRFKAQLNENSKIHAFINCYPELNHNEIVGWETQDEKKINSKVISIIDREYHPQVKRRIEITNDLIKKSGTEIIEMESNENEYYLRLFDLIYLTDWISYYLAVIRNFNPSEIDNIIYLKNELVRK